MRRSHPEAGVFYRMAGPFGDRERTLREKTDALLNARDSALLDRLVDDAATEQAEWDRRQRDQLVGILNAEEEKEPDESSPPTCLRPGRQLLSRHGKLSQYPRRI